MPTKNSVKSFVEGGFYHIYNRGIEKMDIFRDDHDYANFLWTIGEYLKPDHPNPNNPNFIRYGLSDEVIILCYCLMPNHFHLLIKQITSEGITKFMRRISTIYATYFNNCYEHEGKIYQGTYKASTVDTDAYLMQVSAYIHRNPIALCKNLEDYKYSSYHDYLGKRNTAWLNTSEILDIFNTKNDKSSSENYRKYVEAIDLSNDDAFKGVALDMS